MAKINEVLMMLIPEGGWAGIGDTYEGIKFLECEPITKEQFEAGFAQFEDWKAQQNIAEVAKKESAQAKLAALGLTVEDLQVLGL